MNPARRATVCGALSGAAALSLLIPCAAYAEWWTVERHLETTLGTNTNYLLVPDPSNSVSTLSLTGGLLASRQTESSATRFNAGLTAFGLRGLPGQNYIDGSVGLSQTLMAPRNSFNVSGSFVQDTTFDIANGSTDVALGRGQRRTELASGSWSHAFSERLSGSVQGSISRVVYGEQLATASNYRNASLSLGTQYQLDEVDSLNAQIGRSDYRTLDALTRSTTENYSVGLSRALSERSNLSASLGRYASQTTALQPVLVCPLQASLCQAGLVAYVLVQRAGQSSSSGWQYSLSYAYKIDEVTDFAFSAGRQQAPSGTGLVVLSENVSASLGHAFSPTLNGSASYALSKSLYEGVANAPSPGLQTVGVSLSAQLAPQLSVSGAYKYNRSNESHFALSAHSNSLSFTLRYDWPRLEASQ
jgi:hypothetical protein